MIWKYFLIFDTKGPLGIFVGKCQMKKVISDVAVLLTLSLSLVDSKERVLPTRQSRAAYPCCWH